MRIALLNCAPLPEPDPDEAPLLAALHAAGHQASTLAWDAAHPGPTPADFDACVLRATWNYYRVPDAFDAFLARAAAVSTLLNPLPLVRWNLHKRYLLDLQRRGLPIVPTAFVPKGHTPDLRALAADHGWDAVVVKPAVSAGSWRTRRFTADTLSEGSAFLAGITADRDAMVQRYEPAVATLGETSLVWIDGSLTHSVEKRPRFAGQDESVAPRPAITHDQHDLAARVLAAIPASAGPAPLYARIDLFPTDDGRWILSELELIEPSLFFDLGPGSVGRMAAAIPKAIARALPRAAH